MAWRIIIIVVFLVRFDVSDAEDEEGACENEGEVYAFSG